MFADFAERNKGRNAETAVEHGATTEKSARKSKDVEAKLAEYKKPITLADIQSLRAIGRKSINEFTSAEIEIAGKWAYKFYKELGTKSPFFRAWFGDWRSEQKKAPAFVTDIPQGVNLNTQNRKIKNEDTKWSVQVTEDVFGDSLHYAKNDRLYIERLLSHIDEILEKAILLDTAVSDGKKSNKKGTSEFMHYLYAVVEYQKAPFLAKITVEEYGFDGQKRAYNAQRIKMSALSRAQYSQLKAAYRGKNASNADAISIADLHALVKTYDKEFHPKPVNPLLLNEDGTPKVFYHGTNAEFWTFENGHKRTRGRLNLGEGFYFAASKSMAGNYVEDSNGKIIEAYIKIRKPYEVIGNSFTEFEMDDIRSKLSDEDRAKLNYDNVNEYLEKLGYDGIIGYNYSGTKKSIDQVVAFKADQIKSATDNIGTFDDQSKDIRRSTDFEATLADDSAIESIGGRDAKAGAKHASRFSVRHYDKTVGQLRQMIARYTGDKVYSSKEARETIDEIPGIFSLSGKNRAKLYEAMWQGYNSCRTDAERAEFSADMAEYVTVMLLSESSVENPDKPGMLETISKLKRGIGHLIFDDIEKTDLLRDTLNRVHAAFILP